MENPREPRQTTKSETRAKAKHNDNNDNNDNNNDNNNNDDDDNNNDDAKDNCYGRGEGNLSMICTINLIGKVVSSLHSLVQHSCATN